MNIIALIKQVPDTYSERKLRAEDGLLDRAASDSVIDEISERTVEAALQLTESHGGEVTVLCMGPGSAADAIRKALSMGADKAVHLSDDALAGSDVAATGYALAKALESEAPDLVLLGQQSDDGECYTIGAVVAEHLSMPSLTQVIKMDVESEGLRCERQAEYGYDTVQVKLPAVISVGDAINEPRYPSLKAIMGAKKKPLDTVSAGDVGIDPAKVGGENSAAQWVAAKAENGAMVPVVPRTYQSPTSSGRERNGASPCM